VKAAVISFFSNGFRPMRVGAFEFFILRLAFAWLVWQTISYWSVLPFPNQPHPAGLARLIDLTWLSDPAHLLLCQRIALAGLAVYVSGRCLWLALPVVCFIQVAINSLYNSQGYTFHGHQLVGLALLAQTVVVVSLAAYHRLTSPQPRAQQQLQIAAMILFYSQMAVAAAYMVSVVSKVRNSRGQWLFNSHYHAVQLIKTDRQHYYSDPTPETRPGTSQSAAKAEWVAAHPTVSRIMFAGGFFGELLVFLGLKNRRWAVLAGISVIGLHWGIAFIMDLSFPLNEKLVLLLFLNPAYWLRRFLPGGQVFSQPLDLQAPPATLPPTVTAAA